MPEFYQIVVREELDAEWSEWFDGLELSSNERGETVLSGAVTDQAALQGILLRLHDLNLTLLSLSHHEPASPEQAEVR